MYKLKMHKIFFKHFNLYKLILGFVELG